MILKLTPKPLENSSKINPKSDAEKHWKISHKIRQNFRYWLPCWNNLSGTLRLMNVFVSRPVFRYLWGDLPWTDFSIPWGTLGLIFLTFWKMLGANLPQMSKDSRAAFPYFVNKWHQAHLQQKQARIQRKYTDTQCEHIRFLLLLFTKAT